MTDDTLDDRIKPLEWQGMEGGPGRDIYATPSDYVQYMVRHLSEGVFDVILTTDTGSHWFRDEPYQGKHGTYAAAKAFAEADNRKRVSPHLCPKEAVAL